MNDHIRRKIEKLKRLGEHPATDEHEAAAALALAQRLMDEHHISEAVLDDRDDEADGIVWRLIGRGDSWRGVISHALSEANGCSGVRVRDQNGRLADVKVYGRRADVETVAYLFRYCVAEVQRLARVHAAGRGSWWAQGYRAGAAVAIALAIEEESRATLARAYEQYRSNPRALVAIDEWSRRGAAATAARDADYPNLVRSSDVRSGSEEGFAAGRRDGASVYGSRSSGPGVPAGALRLRG